MRLKLETETARLLSLLLLTDMVLIFLHGLGKGDILASALFDLDVNGGYAEIFQYIKEFWLATLLVLLFAIRRKGCYLAWACLFIYMLADDSLQIHERVGAYLALTLELQPAFNLLAVDLGELLVTAAAGGLLFLAIGSTYFSGGKEVRRFSNRLFLLMLFLAGCGVVFDMVESMFTWGRPLWDLIEDGGELVIMSLMLWYVFGQRPGAGSATPAPTPPPPPARPDLPSTPAA